MTFFLIFAVGAFGLAIIIWRLAVNQAKTQIVNESSRSQTAPTLTVIIPARNEADNLPRLLKSLHKNQYPELDLIVVNDRSEENTGEVALSFGAKVIDNPPLPRGWAGKNWACYNGAKTAYSSYLLFTDADTEFEVGALKKLVDSMQENQADLICPVIYHRCENIWERFLGPFHLLYLIATAINQNPKPERLYANGQCLIFRREHYERYGHASVPSALAEDVALARMCLNKGGRYFIYRKTPIFSVNMYDSFGGFLRGWRRIFRLGVGEGGAAAVIEVTSAILAFMGLGLWFFTPETAVLAGASALVASQFQRHYGRFHFLGAVLAPVSVFLFTLITLLALLDKIFQVPVRWKGRTYPSHQETLD
jgi:4,4'-diaponeurosporenoate glycosyltransferase